MQSAYFPMFVDISDKNIVVIGGGHIAARRVNTLLKFTRELTIVSPQLCEELTELVQICSTTGVKSAATIPCAAEGVRWIPREYTPDCLQGVDIVLAATNQREVNRKIVTDCRLLEQKEQRKILVNTADDKAQCDFYFPSVVQSEEITIGINSGGQAPQKVKEMRKKIQKMLKVL